jgi:peptidoglycan/xylan/chitin deacetylase (PgdA/CDA1 family)/glycosyltransferase involved in cell wall biosynthesis
MPSKSTIKGKLKYFLAALMYRSGGFLFIRLLHRWLYGSGIRILYYHRVASASGSTMGWEPRRDSDLAGGRVRATRPATFVPFNELREQPLELGEFEKHLQHLRRFYRVIRLEDAVGYLKARRFLPPNSVVITFDDGYRDNLTEALPALQRHALPASLFVVSGAVDGEPIWLDLVDHWFKITKVLSLRFGKAGAELGLKTLAERRQSLEQVRSTLKSLSSKELKQALRDLRADLEIAGVDHQPQDSSILSWDELRQMAGSGLITIGAHTITHRLLANLEIEEIQREVQDSCDRLSQELGQRTRFFAYPGGAYNSEAQSVVRNLGLVALGTGGGGFNPPGSDLSALRRLGPEGRSLPQFVLSLAGWEDVRDAVRRRLAQARKVFKQCAYETMEAVGFFALLRRLNRNRLVVLLYHGVVRTSETQLNDLHVSAERFRRQMNWMCQKFRPVSLRQVVAAMDGRALLPRRAVLVTFDDGYENNFTVALPILKQLNIRPTIFIPTEFIDERGAYWNEDLEARIRDTGALGIPFQSRWLWLRNLQERRSAFKEISGVLKRADPAHRERLCEELQIQLSQGGEKDTSATEQRCSWDQLIAMKREGVDIGSHTNSHALLPGLPLDEIRCELEDSKKQLELRLSAPVKAFAYPNGDWDSAVRELVEKTGYSCAFTTQPGTNGRHTDRFLLHRVCINATDSLGDFKSAVSGFSRRGMPPSRKILEIGNFPPPECGWARQTKLVVEELARNGAVCEVLNINESRKLKSAEYIDVQNGFDYLGKVLGFALRGYRLHTHVNAESAKGYLLALSANLIGLSVGRPAIMTFHGGLPQSFFPRSDSHFLKVAYRLLFATAGSIICNSVEIKRAIESYGTNGSRIATIPGFSKQYLRFKNKPLPESAETFLSRYERTFLCFVCFRPEYALDCLIGAMQEFLKQQPDAGFIWLGFPTKELPQVEAYLCRLPDGRPKNLLVLENLDHDTYLTLLLRCFAFVRPAACDGVAASVLESMALNVPVVAAENGRRPEGVVTFRFADPVDISAKLQYVVDNYELVKRGTRVANIEDNVEQTAAWLLHPAVG